MDVKRFFIRALIVFWVSTLVLAGPKEKPANDPNKSQKTPESDAAKVGDGKSSTGDKSKGPGGKSKGNKGTRHRHHHPLPA